MRPRMLLGVLAVCLSVAVGSGCLSTAAKQTYYTATGASSRYYEIKPLGHSRSLLEYNSVRAEPFDASPMRGAVPSGLPGQVKEAIERRAAEHDPFMAGGDPALVIRGRFHDYDPGGSALRVVGFSTNPFLTAQIEVVDGRTGRVLGVAMVTGTVKSGVRMGEGELADGVGKAVKGLLKAHAEVPEEQDQ